MEFRSTIYKKIPKCVVFVKKLNSLRISLVILGGPKNKTREPVRETRNPVAARSKPSVRAKRDTGDCIRTLTWHQVAQANVTCESLEWAAAM